MVKKDNQDIVPTRGVDDAGIANRIDDPVCRYPAVFVGDLGTFRDSGSQQRG